MLGSISTVTLFGLLTQVSGLVRMALIAAAMGLSADVDAYYLAMALPSLVVLVVSNWLQMTYLGRYAGLVTAGRLSLAAAFRRRMQFVVLSFIALLIMLLNVAPEALMQLIAGPDQSSRAAAALRYVGFMMLPVAIADFIGVTLNGHQRFALAALAPMVNALVATVALWLWPTQDLFALVASLLLGSVAQLLIILPAYMRLYTAPAAHPHDTRAEMREVWRLTLYVVPAFLFSNALLVVMQASVARLGEGAVSMMSYANRINGGIAQLLILGLGTVLLPFFAAMITREEPQRIFLVFRRLARGAAAVAVFVVAGVYAFGTPVVSVLFGRGQFNVDDAQKVADLLLVLSLSLLPLSLGSWIARYFNAARRADLLLLSGVLGFVGTVGTSVVGVWMNSVRIVGLAPLACYTITTLFWLWALSRDYRVGFIVMDALQGLARMAGPVLIALYCDHWLGPRLYEYAPMAGLGIRLLVFTGAVVLMAQCIRLPGWVLIDRNLKE